MRNVILQEFVSVDGFAADRNGGVDFVPASNAGDQSFGQNQMRFLDSLDTMLLGRVTYSMFAQHWPKVTSGEDKSFADKLNAIPKIVFSNTLDRAPWGDWPEATIVKGSAADEIARLKQQPGKNMVIWGSLSLAQSLMTGDLIDEYQLVICPIVLGNGKPLFRDSSFGMELRTTKSFERGSVLLTYSKKSGE
jgi:dihydrofolate reductase